MKKGFGKGCPPKKMAVGGVTGGPSVPARPVKMTPPVTPGDGVLAAGKEGRIADRQAARAAEFDAARAARQTAKGVPVTQGKPVPGAAAEGKQDRITARIAARQNPGTQTMGQEPAPMRATKPANKMKSGGKVNTVKSTKSDRKPVKSGYKCGGKVKK